MIIRWLSISSTFRSAQFRSADTRRVQGHQHRAMEQVAGRVDQLRYFLRTQDLGSRSRYRLGSRNIFEQIRAASAS